MNVLLDTCALLALANGNLSSAVAATLRKAPEAWVSSVSIWEVAIKVAAGRLALNQPAAAWFAGLAERHRLHEVPLEHRQACAAAALPPIHKDPFDRVLIALAQAHSLQLITNDQFIVQYPSLSTLW
jgi:PIN domain nuclease of toxin-antitoxin system